MKGDAPTRDPCINMLCSFVCVNKLVYVSKYMQLIPYEYVDLLRVITGVEGVDSRMGPELDVLLFV